MPSGKRDSQNSRISNPFFAMHLCTLQYRCIGRKEFHTRYSSFQKCYQYRYLEPSTSTTWQDDNSGIIAQAFNAPSSCILNKLVVGFFFKNRPEQKILKAEVMWELAFHATCIWKLYLSSSSNLNIKQAMSADSSPIGHF